MLRILKAAGLGDFVDLVFRSFEQLLRSFHPALRDVIAQMGFRPLISDELKLMDERIFKDEPMGIHDEFMNA